MNGREAMKKRTPAKCWAVVDEFGGIWAQGSRRFAVDRKKALMRSGVVGRLTIVLLVERRERRKR